jgi:hypothetical protein
LIFWIITAILLHPDNPISNSSNNLIPGGPRFNPVIGQMVNILKKFIAWDTLARLCLLILGFIIARYLTLRFLSDLYDVDQLNAITRFLIRITFGWKFNSKIGFQNGHDLKSFPELVNIGGPAEITFLNDHQGYTLSSNGEKIRKLDRNVVKVELIPFQTIQPSHNAEDGSFSIDYVCRTKDGIRIGLSDIQIKYKALCDIDSQISNQTIVSSYVKSGINKFVRCENLLHLMINETPKKAIEILDWSKKTGFDIHSLHPPVAVIPSDSPLEYRVLYVPEVEFHDVSYSLDICSKILINVNQQIAKKQNYFGLQIQIMSIGNWKCMNEDSKKQLDHIWSYITSPSTLDHPEQISQKKRVNEQGIYTDHLGQIKTILMSSNISDQPLTIMLFYYEFLQRRLEDFRFESLAIPEEISSLLELLEKNIDSTLLNNEVSS